MSVSRQHGPVSLVLEISNPGAGTAAAFVALGTLAGGRIDHESLSPLAGGRDDLHPAIERLCARARVTPADLARVAVSVGPGGYTSLRVAVAAGKLIAEATGAAAVSIPTPRLVARSVAAGGDDAYPRGIALASKGKGCHLSVESAPGELRDVGVISAGSLEALGLRSLIADVHLPRPIAEEAARLGVPIVPVCFDPAAACALAAELPMISADALEVCYAREPDAVTQWRARKSD